MPSEQHERAHHERYIAQENWKANRSAAYRAAYAAAAGTDPSPQQFVEARLAAVAAMVRFENANPPEPLGLPSSLRTDPSAVEITVRDAAPSLRPPSPPG